MKVRCRTEWVCSVCGNAFCSRDAAQKCEESHKAKSAFASEHQPKFALGDIVKYDGTMYRVVNFFVDGLPNNPYYRYELENKSDYDQDGDLCRWKVPEAQLELVVRADEVRIVYDKMDALCAEALGIPLCEFVDLL